LGILGRREESLRLAWKEGSSTAPQIVFIAVFVIFGILLRYVEVIFQNGERLCGNYLQL